ncbi:MAG: hypothetical protein KBB55_03280 [Candidatus Buchananbacteria bacterium]|nr:hypothetical protein [Candidatus Buchananbacteria bacterium]
MESPKPYWSEAIIAGTRVTTWLVGPLIISYLAGNWFERRFETGVDLLLASLGLGFLITIIGLVFETLNYSKSKL